jgi:osmotically-inducible protein OsmY
MSHKISSVGLAVVLGCSAAAGILASGCAGDRYDRSTGEYIDDKGLSMRVRSALADNHEYKFSDVSVTSFRGVVQLSGFVNTADQRRTAGSIAEKVQNVKKVENNISIKEKNG